MDKQSLVHVSGLVAFDYLPESEEGETITEYVQRAYPAFETIVTESSNPVITDIEQSSNDKFRNIASKLSVRLQLVENYCRVNDPFELEMPEDPTDDEILNFNGIDSTAEELESVLDEESYQAMFDKLKVPKNDGLTKTEIEEKRIEHYAKYEPVMPSEKEYSHNSGGTTRKHNWEKDLKSEFEDDHNAFLEAFGLQDSFYSEPEPETAENEDESE